MLKLMMHESDNFFAEQTLLMVGNEKIGIMDDNKTIDTLLKSDFLGIPQKPKWVDGSGLSRYNLMTPQDFVWILKLARPGTAVPNCESSMYKASSGFVKYLANCRSPEGFVAFHLSLSMIGIIASLVNGIPRRDTCTQLPLKVEAAPVALKVVI